MEAEEDEDHPVLIWRSNISFSVVQITSEALLNPGQGDLLANALTIYRLRVLTSEFILSGSEVGGLFSLSE